VSHVNIVQEHGVTRAAGKVNENQQLQNRLLQSQSLAVDQVLPSRAEMARQRALYAANTGAGTAIAPVTSLPTTTAAWALYNGSQTKNLIVLDITAHSVSGTLGLGAALVAGLPGTPQAAAATAYASSVSNPITPGSSATAAIFANAVTLASAPVWITVATTQQVAAVSIGAGVIAKIDGLFIVPPKHALGASVLAPTGTAALFNVGFVWFEHDLDLG